jgi:fatty acid desaturase
VSSVEEEQGMRSLFYFVETWQEFHLHHHSYLSQDKDKDKDKSEEEVSDFLPLRRLSLPSSVCMIPKYISTPNQIFQILAKIMNPQPHWEMNL